LVTVGLSAVIMRRQLRVLSASFAGPQRDAWNLLRHDLSRADQLHVTWSTSRRRPVSRAYLAPAQLVYTRYAQDAAERSPLNNARRRFWRTVPMAVIGGADVCFAATATPVNIFNLAIGSWITFMAGVSALRVPRMRRDRPRQLLNLRRQIRATYPNDWV
jgi:hypothetical protein